jgi:hypothetical protein
MVFISSSATPTATAARFLSDNQKTPAPEVTRAERIITMTNAKYSKAMNSAQCGKYGDTFRAIMETLGQLTDLNKLTAVQIGQVADAMYASNQHGYNAGLRA